MTLATTLTKLRRFLRDPNGDIWLDADLLTYWNDAQVEIAQKSLLLVNVQAHHYPPEYTYTATQDWEKNYIDGDKYCCFEQSMTRNLSFSYVWESAYYLDSLTTAHSGYRFTQPWETYYASAGDFVPVPLYSQIDRMMLCAYDRQPIDPISRKELSESNPYYRTQTGVPTNYWRLDDYSNQVVLYPHPSMVLVDPDYTDVFDDAGGIVTGAESALDDSDLGIITDIVDLDDSLFMVFQALSLDVAAWTDETDLPPWFLKAVECGALERAYGADTDGFIPSLRDYWKTRKDIQLKLMKKFKVSRLVDRDFVMGGFPKATRSGRARLPDGYPATNP